MAKKIKRRHEQTSIPGTEVELPETVRDAVHKWLDDCDEARQVSKRRKMSHDVMIQHMQEAGVERAPYVDSITGKKKHVYADRTPKAKVINAPRPPKFNARIDRERPEIDAELAADKNADKVEVRRVSRASVADEIKPRHAAKVEAGDNADPFARTRGLLDEASDKQNPNTTEH